MSKLQTTRYKSTKMQKIVIILIIIVLVILIGSVIYAKLINPRLQSKPEDVKSETQEQITHSATQEQVDNTTAEITEKNITTNTTEKEIQNIKEIVIVLKEGEIYGEQADGDANLYYYPATQNNKDGSATGDDVLEVHLPIDISPELIEFEGIKLNINLTDNKLELDSYLTSTFIDRLDYFVNSNPDFSFSDKWKTKVDQLVTKQAQLDEVTGVDIKELPDEYPASYAHATINIASVDKNSFDTFEDAEKYAQERLPVLAKENNISGFILSQGLLNNGQIKHLIYWIK